MKRTFLLALLLAFSAAAFGCHTAEPTPTSELQKGMRQQMLAVRTQMKNSGATPEQLREFDKAMAELNRQMKNLDKQMQAMEK